MVLELHLHASLKRYVPSSSSGILTVDVPDGITVLELLNELEMDPQEVKTVVVNKISVNPYHILQDGDHIEMSPGTV